MYILIAYEYQNYFSSTYIFFPSAIPVKKKQLNVHVDDGLLYNANYGITSNLCVEGGFEIASLLGHDEMQYVLNAKLGFEIVELVEVYIFVINTF